MAPRHSMKLIKELRVKPGEKVKLADRDTGYTGDFAGKSDSLEPLQKNLKTHGIGSLAREQIRALVLFRLPATYPGRRLARRVLRRLSR